MSFFHFSYSFFSGGGTTIITEKCPTLIEKGVVIFYDAVIKIPSVNSATKHYIGRYVIATTGNINDKAKEMINKARLKDHDRRIKYWDGEQLVEYIREYWLTEFINYFGIDAPSKKEPFQSSAVIDSDYMIENYGKLVKKIDKMRKSLNSAEFEILTVVAYICSSGDIHAAADADIFIELGHPEEYYRDEIEKLMRYDFLGYDEGYFVNGSACCIKELYDSIFYELEEADENESDVQQIFNDII